VSDRGRGPEAETVRDARSTGGGTPTLPAAAHEELRAGSVLGPFRIDGLLGAGGMGAVYRATDTRLKREVAIKLCDAQFAARFDREAKAIAALNHPHICTLYDVGPNYLVMELIDGETLAKLLARGPLPLATLLSYGTDIADALAEAHAAGIAHRDLKPGNIIVGSRGVKVLDFGLARMDLDVDDVLTRSNAVMGTPHYMAPEQARGIRANAEADMFALGLVLHEMATGKLPYPGASFGNMLASDESVRLPEHSGARSSLPPRLDALIARLLAADPAKRPRSAQVRDELRALAAPRPGGRIALWLSASVVIAALMVAGVWWLERADPPTFEVGTVTQLANLPGDKLDPAFSPDGDWLAFSWTGENNDRPGIYVLSTAGGDPRRLTQSATNDIAPTWSPDGRRIAYQRQHPGLANELMWVPFDSGSAEAAEQRLRDVPSADGTLRATITWTALGDALLVPMFDAATQRGSLFRIGLDGSPPQRVVAGENASIHSPAVSADGRWLSYVAGFTLRAQRVGADGSLEGGPIDIVSEGLAVSPAWAPDGSQLLFLRPGEFRILGWDVRTRTLQTVYVASSTPQSMSVTWDNGNPEIALSTLGRQTELRALDLAGTSGVSGAPHLLFQGAQSGAYSPDGRWVAFSRQSRGVDVWIAQVDGAGPRQLTNLGARALREVAWSPDGRQIAFHARLSSNAQVFVLDVDLDAETAEPPDATLRIAPRRPIETEFNLVSPQWSHDGRDLYVLRYDVGRGRLMRVPAAGGELEDLFESDGARLHPSEERIYYLKSGQTGIFTRSLLGDVRANPEERLVTDMNPRGGFDVSASGIYYNSIDAAGNPEAIRFYNFASEQSFDVTPLRLPPEFFSSLHVSADGRRLIYDAMSDDAGTLLFLELHSRRR